MTCLLLVADRKTTIDAFQAKLERSDFSIVVATGHRAALRMARQRGPDVIVVDGAAGRLSLPRLFESFQRLMDAPVIGIVPRAEGHTLPFADVLVRPYTNRQLEEVIARTLASYPRTLELDGLHLDLRTRLLTAAHYDGPQTLPPKIFALLCLLMRNANEVVSRTDLMQQVWSTTFMQDTRTLDVHIRWVREIIDPPGAKHSRLQTVRCQGYRLLSEPSP